MTGRDDGRTRAPGVAEVHALERKLETASERRAAVETRLARTRERAERIVAEARERAAAEARALREEALTELEHEQRQIRRRAAERAEALRAAVGGEREAPITAFVQLILPRGPARDGS
jgi:F0F1-type ATP synthase membrane subunit b/b'